MAKKIKTIIIMSVFTLLLLSSCGRNRADSVNERTEDGVQTSHTVTTAVNDEPDVRVLTALAPARFRLFFNIVARQTRTEQLAMGNDFQFELTAFYERERSDIMTRMQVMTMAGHLYDLMVLDGQAFYALAERGFLVDFYDLIDQDPNLNRDDFFTNVLEAFEFRGGLYAMPLNFGFEYVGINSKLPQSIINRFSQFSTVSMNDLLPLYLDLMRDYPQYNHLAFGPYFEFDRIVKFEMGSHINTLERRSTLNSGAFESFLSKMMETRQFNDNFVLRDDRFMLIQVPFQIEEVAFRYVFSNHRARLDTFNALFEFEDPLFSHFVPLADSHGRLKIDYGPWGTAFDMGDFCISMGSSSTFASIMIGVGADRDIAWNMVLNMIDSVSAYSPCGTLYGLRGASSDPSRDRILNLATPIMRTFFDTHYTTIVNTRFPLSGGGEQSHTGRAIRGIWGNFLFQPPVGGSFVVVDNGTLRLTPNAHAQVANMKERILGYTEMPMVTPPFSLPSSVYESALNLLMLGIITPQVAVQDIHNRVSLWLIE